MSPVTERAYVDAAVAKVTGGGVDTDDVSFDEGAVDEPGTAGAWVTLKVFVETAEAVRQEARASLTTARPAVGKPGRVFEVTRYTPSGAVAKRYGAFTDRAMADRVARAAAEKHGDLVVVEPKDEVGR